jgi:thiol:disulfide interchange protein DsbC
MTTTPRILLAAGLALATVLVTGNGLAETDKYAAVQSKLKLIAPGSPVDGIAETPVNGVLEVLLGGTVLYITEDGRHIFQGNLIDTNSLTNLTEERRKNLRATALNEFGEEGMIVFPAKEPRHTITVFTDIDCGYCRKLHNEMSEYNANGITVRYLSFPRSGPNSASFNKAVSVWCAKDRNAAMTSAKAGKDMPKKDCDNPVKDHFDLGMKMGVAGTPAILMENGSLLPGYVPPKRLSQELDKQAAAKS